ncbi:hypothetical protein KCP71_10780 [Salmonella enterica subsp. enterica]|nr:hypothetical protein KCP71_10780 [Salmonella enterica subsp. enterica]
MPILNASVSTRTDRRSAGYAASKKGFPVESVLSCDNIPGKRSFDQTIVTFADNLDPQLAAG